MNQDDYLLVCLMGLPRIGKSTLARKLSNKINSPIINRDSIRLALHGHAYIHDAEPMVKVVAKLMVKSLFFAGHKTVVVDETNTTRSRRDFWTGKDWQTQFHHVTQGKGLSHDVNVCLERAEKTQPELKAVIKNMAETFTYLERDEVVYDLPKLD